MKLYFPHVFDDFLDMMKGFKSQALNIHDVIAGVKELFRGHPEVILNFNIFLPHDCKIERGQITTVVDAPQVYTTQ